MKKIQIINSGDHYKTWLGNELVNEIEETTGLVMFTGGPDVPPILYKENNRFASFNMNRTLLEMEIYKEAIVSETPILGICYGSQFITAMQPNGKVIQDVGGHIGSHKIFSREDMEEYETTSTHHQMMYPFDINEYEILAQSSEKLSNRYLYDEGDYKDILCEPEIVYYPNTNVLAIQGHPEFNNCPEETREYCRKLIKKYLLKN